MHHAKSLRALLVEGAQPKLGVRALLDGSRGSIELVQADDLDAALGHLVLESFDVILFAICPARNLGPKALRRILVSVPEVPVIVLALVADAKLAQQSIISGAQDFWISPDDSSNQLVRSIASAIARKSSLDQLVRRANYDRVTGLPNRYLFDDRLHHAAAQAERHDRPMAVLFVDIDRFKAVNDALGHRMGDRVLKRIAERISCAVRRVDTAARIGGDEFAIILENLERVEDASIVAQKLLDVLASRSPSTTTGSRSLVASGSACSCLTAPTHRACWITPTAPYFEPSGPEAVPTGISPKTWASRRSNAFSF
jgi:diguanylate cyclase (GGDEF)-like protein